VPAVLVLPHVDLVHPRPGDALRDVDVEVVVPQVVRRGSRVVACATVVGGTGPGLRGLVGRLGLPARERRRCEGEAGHDRGERHEDVPQPVGEGAGGVLLLRDGEGDGLAPGEEAQEVRQAADLHQADQELRVPSRQQDAEHRTLSFIQVDYDLPFATGGGGCMLIRSMTR
jgi:hypothetical protein